MDPIDWDAIRAIQRNMHPNHQNDVNNSIENAPRTNIEWDTYCEYSRPTVGEAHSSMIVNVEHERLSPSFHKVYIKDSEVQDPDGEPLPSDEEDPELSRKRKELREIEERIMFKKAAIALKAVEPTLPNVSSNAATYKGATLKDRVNVILQKRNPVGFNSMFWSHRERMHSSRLSKDSLLQNNHPLKLRVKALMKRRCSDPARRECGETPPSPPSRSFTSPAKEETIVNKGFQRFLSVLNKGVDIDFLSRIVNDDDEDLLSGEQLLTTQPPAVEKEPHPSFRSEGQRSNSEASLPGFSQTNRGHDTFCIPGDEESRNEGGESKFGSSIRSKSPVSVVKKNEEEDKPKVDVQREQLQNILKTLGLNLEVEEMSKLEDRTQERLYGKKNEDTNVEGCRGAQESQQSGPQRHFSNSSSSSSSRSTKSRSLSPSLPMRQCSPSRNLERKSEQTYSRERRDRIIDNSRDRFIDRSRERIIDRSRDRFRDRSRDRVIDRSRERIIDRSRDRFRDRSRDRIIDRSRDRSRDRFRDRSRERIIDRSRERIRDNSKNRIGDRSREIVIDRSRDGSRNSLTQNQTNPHPKPDNCSTFPQCSLSEDSQYTAYDKGTYSSATNTYWGQTQVSVPPSLYPGEGPYPLNPYHNFPDSVGEPHMVNPYHNPLDTNFSVNPDLSMSEGQVASFSTNRCLQVIDSTQQCVMKKNTTKNTTKSYKKKLSARRIRKVQYWENLIAKREQKPILSEVPKAEAEVDPPPFPPKLQENNIEHVSQPEPIHKEKRQPTEEEIKANLRKTLEAFNQKVKQRVPQPNFPSPHTDYEVV
ncbi:uncharacterized protein LOC117482181 isoform X1 [Trematomus bernacchii]|uniref:uncharacterized protein LOC117482181 isoform X1 n=1 Tax=Trematomus bernacchii TaxID=40690 RepID=UPI00146EFA9A|nr:uncharacterized protein LOC117482181 isoform X1 [Trematomus bernacchii]XP_033986088.1 uncharacterized protein LOC117482181 isoform X1 [Trematomus bernacchii]